MTTKSDIRATPNISTDADKSTNTAKKNQFLCLYLWGTPNTKDTKRKPFFGVLFGGGTEHTNVHTEEYMDKEIIRNTKIMLER